MWMKFATSLQMAQCHFLYSASKGTIQLVTRNFLIFPITMMCRVKEDANLNGNKGEQE